eukprot:1155018-Pelagomonas_calceolata.AAC.6
MTTLVQKGAHSKAGEHASTPYDRGFCMYTKSAYLNCGWRMDLSHVALQRSCIVEELRAAWAVLHVAKSILQRVSYVRRALCGRTIFAFAAHMKVRGHISTRFKKGHPEVLFRSVGADTSAWRHRYMPLVVQPMKQAPCFDVSSYHKQATKISEFVFCTRATKVVPSCPRLPLQVSHHLPWTVVVGSAAAAAAPAAPAGSAGAAPAGFAGPAGAGAGRGGVFVVAAAAAAGSAGAGAAATAAGSAAAVSGSAGAGAAPAPDPAGSDGAAAAAAAAAAGSAAQLHQHPGQSWL